MGLLQAVVFQALDPRRVCPSQRWARRGSRAEGGDDCCLVERNVYGQSVGSFHRFLRRTVCTKHGTFWHFQRSLVDGNKGNCFPAETQQRQLEGYLQKDPHLHDTVFGRLCIFQSLGATCTRKSVYTIAWCGRLTKATEREKEPSAGSSGFILLWHHFLFKLPTVSCSRRYCSSKPLVAAVLLFFVMATLTVKKKDFPEDFSDIK